MKPVRSNLFIIGVSLLISTCASLSSKSSEYVPATLTEAADNHLRERVRLYVREHFGAAYIADLSEMETTGRIMLRDREYPHEPLNRLPLPERTLQLMTSGEDAGCFMASDNAEMAPTYMQGLRCRPL